MNRSAAKLLLLPLALGLGCTRVPPSNIPKDRFDYGHAIGESWKRQTLMNVVRLRYGDAPVFLDVASVINSYTRSGTANVGAKVVEAPDPSEIGVGAAGAWSNTPTVTYLPLLGDKFSKSLLTPIPPVALMQLTQAGWSAHMVYPIALRSVNGIRNQTRDLPGNPRFGELIMALERIHQMGAVGVRLERGKDGDQMLMLIGSQAAEGQAQEVRTILDALGLEPGLKEFTVAFGAVPRNNREVAMQTRSMIEIMMELGFGVEVPERDAREHRVIGSGRVVTEGPAWKPIVRIHSGSAAPADAYSSVKYRDTWFWIDDRDVDSKQKFTFLMILFSLAETGQSSAAPVVTVNAR